MKILAVGMNYALHKAELGHNEDYREPVIFLKPDSALLKDGRPFFLPDFSADVQYEAELVVRICRLGKCIPQQFAHRYYDAVTVGIDFTARDMQRTLRSGGLPWTLSKGFDDSAVIGTLVPLGTLGRGIQDLHFTLSIDGQTVQRGYTGDMLFSVDEIVAYVSRFMTLKMGDLIYTGTPAGVGPVKVGQHLEGCLEGEKVLSFNIR